MIKMLKKSLEECENKSKLLQEVNNFFHSHN